MYTGYYPDGTIKMKGIIKDGNKVGVWTLYDPLGNISGYYKTFYGAEPIPYAMDSMGVDSVVTKYPTDSTPLPNDTVEANNTKEPKNNNRKQELRRWLSKSVFIKQYFFSKPNEYSSVIVSTNPFAPLLSVLPFNVEYYTQERIGYELSFALYKDPFFSRVRNVDNNSIFQRGYSLSLTQKFYRRRSSEGSIYFAHQIRVRSIDYNANYQPTSLPTADSNRAFLSAREVSYEYCLLFGDRILQRYNKPGWALDFYIGAGIGYRTVQRNWPANDEYDKVFVNLSTQNVYIPIRLGFSIGYLF